MAGIIYLGLFIFSAVFSLGAFIFGHDGGDHDVSADHDVGHDGGHGDGMPSIFSTRVISLFLVGFSGMGLIATYVWHLSPGVSAFCGLGSGAVMGALAYMLIVMFHRSQASSFAEAEDYIGLDGRIATAIPQNGTGEITIAVKGQARTIFAVTADGNALPAGQTARIKKMTGATATVEPMKQG